MKRGKKVKTSFQTGRRGVRSHCTILWVETIRLGEGGDKSTYRGDGQKKNSGPTRDEKGGEKGKWGGTISFGQKSTPPNKTLTKEMGTGARETIGPTEIREAFGLLKEGQKEIKFSGSGGEVRKSVSSRDLHFIHKRKKAGIKMEGRGEKRALRRVRIKRGETAGRKQTAGVRFSGGGTGELAFARGKRVSLR